MKDFLTIIIVTLLVITVFIATINIGEHSLDNSLLTDDSRTLIEDIATTQDQEFNNEQFEEGDSTLAEDDSTFDSEDTFSREFLEARSEGQKKTNLAERLLKLPDLIFISIGVPDSAVSSFKWVVSALLGIFVSFAGYRAFFGPGRITQN